MDQTGIRYPVIVRFEKVRKDMRVMYCKRPLSDKNKVQLPNSPDEVFFNDVNDTIVFTDPASAITIVENRSPSFLNLFWRK